MSSILLFVYIYEKIKVIRDSDKVGRHSNYEAGLFNELEKLNKKLDALLKENKSQTFTIYNLNLEIEKLNKTIQEKDEKIEKLLEEIDRLKNKNNKNSSNSSKPSSTNMTTPKKKTGANIYNYRKTGKKCGGQYGHIGHSLSKKNVEELIDNKKIEVREYTHIIKGKSTRENIIKYKLGIEIKPYVEKHIFKHDESSENALPSEFYTDVTYDNSIKVLSIELSAYHVISYDRLSDFFNVITDGVIQISKGNLVNILYEFSNKSNPTLKVLEEDILNSKYNHTDETVTKFNGKNMYVRNYSNENTVIYKVHKNKGHKPIKEDNILTRFCGGIMGDHDTTLHKYGTRNYECNIHLGRYLEELIQNIKDIIWPIKMKELIFRMNNTRKIAISFGLKKFDKDKINGYIEEFDNLLELAKEENKCIKSSYYKDKANKLYRRLKKYKKNHLYFIKDFEVPFDNNLSEQDLRVFKTKTKISGGFRSMKAAEHYVNVLSIIKTSIKRNINPFESIKAIFNNQILFSS